MLSRSCPWHPPAPCRGWIHPMAEGSVQHGTAQPSLKATLGCAVPAQVSRGVQWFPGQEKYIPPLDSHIVDLSQICVIIYRLY